MWADEADFASPSGLPAEQLAAALVEAFAEVGGGRQAAVELLRRTGNWLEDLDAAGFVSLGSPHPDDPDARPRAVIRWAEALEAAGWGGALHREGRGRCHDLALLHLAAGLAGAVPVNLEERLRDLDRERTSFVLAAVNASTQSHVVSRRQRLPDGRDTGRHHMSLADDSLFPWPDPPEPVVEGVLELPLFPERLAEESALAWAEAHPAPAVDLPLPTEVIDLLQRLRPAQGRAAGASRAGRRGRTLMAGWQPREDDEIQDWLGFPLPDLTPLTEQGHRRVCFSPEAGALPDRAAGLPIGHDRQGPVLLAWMPSNSDLNQAPRPGAGAGARPVTTMAITVDDRTLSRPRPSVAATNLWEPAGGWTRVTLAGRVLTVQRAGSGFTRIAWARSGDPGDPQFTVQLPMEPVAALELLLAGRDVP